MNFGTAWSDGVTSFTQADMLALLNAHDKAISYHHNMIVHCDGAITYNKATGALAWGGALKIIFLASTGVAMANTAAASSITLADNEFAYVDLIEVNNNTMVVGKAAITTGAAANFAGVARVVLGYRNTTTDEFHPVALKPVFAPGALFNNFSASVAPAVSNDGTQGYVVGSRWINVVLDKDYVCLDNATGAAIWKETTDLKDKFDATAAPAVTDDGTQGYAVGSRWADITNDKEYVCLDSTTGAAVWQLTTTGSTFVSQTDTPASYTGQALKLVRVNSGATALEFVAAPNPAFGVTTFEYTATAAQTIFTGADDNTRTLAYTAGNIIVFDNGSMVDPNDYTATNGTSVVFTVGRTLGNPINIVYLSSAGASKANLNATAAPAVTDDNTLGYSAGSHWIDLTNDKAYICVDDTTGAAVWIDITSGGKKNNDAATTAPTTSNDNTQGYSVGSRWSDTTNDKTYFCIDASTGAAIWTNVGIPAARITIACSDETTALTTGVAKVTFRMPYGFTISEVRASVTTAPTGANLIVDVKKNGVSIFTTNLLSIDATEKTSKTAATPPNITTSSLADDDEMTIDITQIGSTVAGTGLKVTLIGVSS